jgi:hypothetical protein
MAMGRPKKPAKERQSEIVGLRFTPAERKLFEQDARKAGLSLSEYLRSQLGLRSKSK